MEHYLSMLVEDISKKTEGVWETLGSSTLAHTDNTMLFWVKHSSLQRIKHFDSKVIQQDTNCKMVFSLVSMLLA